VIRQSDVFLSTQIRRLGIGIGIGFRIIIISGMTFVRETAFAVAMMAGIGAAFSA